MSHRLPPAGDVQVQVAHGRVAGYRGVRFGGVAYVPPVKDAPAWVRVAIRCETIEFHADLREGDALKAGNAAWRLDRIHVDQDHWHAEVVLIS